MQVYITAVEEGFLYGLLALGIYISLRILDIPDLTTEGSFGFGSAVAAVVASKGLSITSFIAAFFAGVLAGIVTGLLQTKLKVHPVLAGIITMSGLYSINLMVGVHPTSTLTIIRLSQNFSKQSVSAVLIKKLQVLL